MKKIKLGNKLGGALTTPAPTDEPYYPQMHIDHPESINIPDEGMATIKHKVVSRHIDKKHGKHSATLEIHSFEPHPKKKTSMEGANAMQALMDNAQ